MGVSFLNSRDSDTTTSVDERLIRVDTSRIAANQHNDRYQGVSGRSEDNFTTFLAVG
jgi:hypothetical protein